MTIDQVKKIAVTLFISCALLIVGCKKDEVIDEPDDPINPVTDSKPFGTMSYYEQIWIRADTVEDSWLMTASASFIDSTGANVLVDSVLLNWVPLPVFSNSYFLSPAVRTSNKNTWIVYDKNKFSNTIYIDNYPPSFFNELLIDSLNTSENLKMTITGLSRADAGSITFRGNGFMVKKEMTFSGGVPPTLSFTAAELSMLGKTELGTMTIELSNKIVASNSNKILQFENKLEGVKVMKFY